VLDPHPYVKLFPINNMLVSATAWRAVSRNARLADKTEVNFILNSLIIHE
jgi:hypothetical protein